MNIKILFLIFFFSGMTFSYSQFFIAHVQLLNTDAKLNVVLSERTAAVGESTAAHAVIFTAFKEILTQLVLIHDLEYFQNSFDKQLFVDFGLNSILSTVLALPKNEPDWFPLYRTIEKTNYLEGESIMRFTIGAENALNGYFQWIRNGNTQEMYYLKKELSLSFESISKNPKRVLAFLCTIALLKKVSQLTQDQLFLF